MREEALSTPDLYSNVRVLSRHALEVEQSLQKGTPKASSLRHLVQPRLQGMKIRRIASKLKKQNNGNNNKNNKNNNSVSSSSKETPMVRYCSLLRRHSLGASHTPSSWASAEKIGNFRPSFIWLWKPHLSWCYSGCSIMQLVLISKSPWMIKQALPKHYFNKGLEVIFARNFRLKVRRRCGSRIKSRNKISYRSVQQTFFRRKL